jgi:nucleotide-binding universal stress UspA family protein
MFENVLIGLDGGQGGRDALSLAQQLAAPGATFTLVHVCGPFYNRGAAAAFPVDLAESEKMLEREREVAGLEAQVFVAGPRQVGPGLHELARDQQADLIVVGSTRHGFLGRVLIGDDSRGTLDGSPCAIAVAPKGYALVPHPLRRLGVGYDGSPESERALTAARELAATHTGTVKAFRVVSLEDVRRYKPIPADWPDATDELIECHSQRLAQLDDVQGVVTSGGPREELVQAGKELDLLIVGSRGFGPAGRLLHGSVSRYLVGHANCPLLVLPRQAAAAAADQANQVERAAARATALSAHG